MYGDEQTPQAAGTPDRLETERPADIVDAIREDYRTRLRTIRSCCHNPRLEWRGTAENAEIVCAGCGFILADDGQLIDWHDPKQIAWQKDLEATIDDRQ